MNENTKKTKDSNFHEEESNQGTGYRHNPKYKKEVSHNCCTNPIGLEN
jgi:hypothetical protein